MFSATKSPNNETNDNKINPTDACYMSHQFLEKALKSPSTAEWEKCYNVDVHDIGNNTFAFYSYVDSQNSFGAMLRTEYYAEVEYIGDDYWKLKDYTFYD